MQKDTQETVHKPYAQYWILSLSIVCAIWHFAWYRRVLPYELWKLSGGIVEHGNSASYGGTWAWAVPLEVPSCIFMESSFPPLALFGFLLLFLLSGFAGYVLTSVAVSSCIAKRFEFGRFAWKFWGILLTYVWFPVPVEWSWIYQWTVAY